MFRPACLDQYHSESPSGTLHAVTKQLTECAIENFQYTRANMSRYLDTRRQAKPRFNVVDKVTFDARNIKWKSWKKKLPAKSNGPYPMTWVNTGTYSLDLEHGSRMFHHFLIRVYNPTTILLGPTDNRTDLPRRTSMVHIRTKWNKSWNAKKGPPGSKIVQFMEYSTWPCG